MIDHQTHNSRGNYSYNRFEYQDVQWKPHFHKNFEVIYVSKGRVRAVVDDKERVMQAGEFGMVLPNEVHSYSSVGESVCWIMVFSGDFVHAFEKKVQNKLASDFCFCVSDNTRAFVKENLMNAVVISRFAAKAALYALCDAFLSSVTLKEKSGKSDLLLSSITDYISKNYQNKITLSNLAQKLGYNYHYLSKCFHKIFEVPFSEFINSYRLDAAINLLRETDMGIADIAFESGFQSVRNFNQFFKKKIGITPEEYRKQ